MDLQKILSSASLFFGGWFLPLFLAGFSLFLVAAGKRARSFWGLYLLLTAFFLFNPLIAWGVHSMGGSYGESVYYRLFWMVPYNLLIAAGVLLAWDSLLVKLRLWDIPWIPIAVMIYILVIFTARGGSYLTAASLEEPGSGFLASDEVMEVNAILSEDAEKKGIQNPSFLAEDYLCRNLSIISDTMVMGVNRDAVLHYPERYRFKSSGLARLLQSALDGNQEHEQKIKRYLKTADLDYIITRRDYDMAGFYKKCRLTLIGHTRQYDIFRNRRRVLKVYDEKNHLVEKTFANSKGEPEMRYLLTYATVRYTYDRQGNVRSETYFDAEGNPAMQENGSYGCLYEYTRYHKISKCSYLDAEGNLAMTNEGYAYVTYSYKGRKVEATRFFDTEGYEVLPPT